MDDLAIRPLNARSLVLSVLLGLPRPRLEASAIARLAELSGVAAGTMRTAVSRMVGTGELTLVDGGYELAGRLLARRAAQDVGRRPAGDAWDGTWWVVTTLPASRDLATRRDFRVAMANARMGELRPDTWLRPANLAGPGAVEGAVVVRGQLSGAPGTEVVRRLWDLEALGTHCRRLLAAIDDGIHALGSAVHAPGDSPPAQVLGGSSAQVPPGGSPAQVLGGGIALTAAVVRFLRVEPLLPDELVPAGWPADELRRRYGELDRALGRVLRDALGVAAQPSRPG